MSLSKTFHLLLNSGSTENLLNQKNKPCFFCQMKAFFFRKNFFKKFFQDQTVWIQIRTDCPDLGRNRLERLSADDKSSC